MRHHRGFTLIELLIVIVIIGLLFALLVGTMAGLDFMKKNTGCQKRLKDIHTAFQAYMGDGRSGGRYPYPIDTYYGRSFTGQISATAAANDPWAALPHLTLLKQYGADEEMFHCPFDTDYGASDPSYRRWPNWARTWTTPYVTGSDPVTVYVHIGYTFFTYRSYPYNNTRFSNGLSPVINDSSLDTTPIVADILHYRNEGFKSGWYHGGGPDEGLFNSGCNTLFKSGAVVSTDKGSFDWNDPAFSIGSSLDLYWCALQP